MPSVNETIATLRLDNSQLIKDAEEARTNMDKLKKSQKELRKEAKELAKENKTDSARFKEIQGELVRVESAVKSTSKEYRSYQKIIGGLTSNLGQQQLQEEQLNAILSQEATTIEQVRAQNAALNQIRNKTNFETEEGQEQLQKINERLNQNNSAIKENVDNLSQQRMNVGNYSNSIQDAVDKMGGFGGALSSMNGGFGKFGGVISSAISGMQGFTRASLAFIATPIGIILAAIAAAFALIQNALKRSESATDRLTEAFAPLKGIVNLLMGALEPLGDLLINGIAKGFELVEATILSTIKGLEKVADFLGFDNLAESAHNLASSIKDASDQAKELVKVQEEITSMQRELTINTAAYSEEIERQKGIRDDASRSTQERLRAEAEVTRLNQKRLQENIELVEEQLRQNALSIAQEGDRADLLDKQADLTAKMFNLREKSMKEERRNLKKANQLRADAIKQQEKIRQNIIDRHKEELELFQLQFDQSEGFGGQVDHAQEVADKRQAILQEELDNGNISQTKFQSESIKIQNDLTDKLRELSEKRTQDVMDALSQRLAGTKELNEKILENQDLTNDEVFQRLLDNNQRIFEETMEANRRLHEEGALTDEEFAQAEAEAKADRDEANEEAERERHQEQFDRLVEESKRRIQLIEEEEERKRQLRKMTVQAYAQTLGIMASLTDKNSVAEKTLAVAQAIINVWRGAARALDTPWPMNLVAYAQTLATGSKAVQTISSTNVPSMSSAANVGGGTASAPVTFDLPQGVSTSNNRSAQDSINDRADQINDRIADAVADGARRGTREGSHQGISEGVTNSRIANESAF